MRFIEKRNIIDYMKKISIFIISILFATIPAVARDYLYFGGNYSNIIGNNFINHAIGGNISAIGDYGGLKRLYVSIGFIGDVSGNRNINTYELKKIGVNGINTRFFAVPLRFGYPSLFNINENIQFIFTPSIAFDIQFFHADFKQKLEIYGTPYNMEYKLSGWGYSLGVATDVGMQHKIHKVYLRYGIDFDMRLYTFLLADIKYSGTIKGDTSSIIMESIADYFMLTTSPYIAIGFKLR